MPRDSGAKNCGSLRNLWTNPEIGLAIGSGVRLSEDSRQNGTTDSRREQTATLVR